MFDKWHADIFQAISCIKGSTVREPSDVILANSVLLMLFQSPLWGGNFEGAELVVHADDSGYAYITLPKCSDPFDNHLKIRDSMKIMAGDYLYEYPDYWDDDLDYPSPLPYNRKANTHIFTLPPETPELENLMRELSNDAYYAMLLERRPDHVARLVNELKEYKITIYSEMDFNQLNQLCHMGPYGGNMAKNVFGHRYANETANRIHIVAENKLGPIGILCLFDHSKKSVSLSNPNLLSVSYISVTPNYRRLGIASALMRTAMEYCMENKKILGRTAPTKMGKLSHDRFSQIGQEEFPILPFMNSNETGILEFLSSRSCFNQLPYEKQSRYLKECLDFSRRHPTDSLYDVSPEVERYVKLIAKKIDKNVTPSFEVV